MTSSNGWSDIRRHDWIQSAFRNPHSEIVMNRWHAFTQLVLSRFREFYREPEVIFWVYGFPLILAVGLGIAFAGGRPEPPVVDIEGTESNTQVQALAEVLRQGGMKVEVNSGEEARRRLRTGKIALVVIPKAKDADLVFILDETRSECVLAQRWVEAVWLRDGLGSAAPHVEEEHVEEPGSRYIDFLVPGLMGMNIMGGGLFGVGFVLVDMRVRKLFKRFLATPMRRADFLLAIFVARKVFLIPEMIALLVVGRLVFGVPIAGDLFTLILVILIGALAFDSLGLLLGCRAEKMESASGLVNLVMLPMYIFSGVFFSSKRFPEEIQPFIQALPLTQLNDALREVMLEGASLLDIAWRLGILLAWTAASLFLALRWFRWR
jgi:ABC-2 type transport system permease protein